MPTYKKVYSWNDLPKKSPKDIAETLTLDFKGHHKKDPAEQAKDMAAFANAQGGVILIGVAETADNYERTLLPLPQAKLVAKHYEDAARDLLAPRPLVDPVVVEFPGDAEKALVAVNVDPFPGQLIGALVPSTDAWRFPVRVATRHTKYIDPEKAMIYADPRTRKAAILLAQIPLDTTVKIQVRVLLGSEGRGRVTSDVLEGRLLALGERESNVARFSARDGQTLLPIDAPLEDVEAVWHDGHLWAVRLSGCIRFPRVTLGSKGPGEYLSGSAAAL
jgi:hypothetical protein